MIYFIGIIYNKGGFSPYLVLGYNNKPRLKTIISFSYI
jgi:hypothetical protein